jgi:hypothetical protein
MFKKSSRVLYLKKMSLMMIVRAFSALMRKRRKIMMIKMKKVAEI